MALTTVTGSLVSVNAIQGTLIADNAITAVHIATNAVSGTLIADNAITAVHIAQNSITVTQLADDCVESDKIADGIITTNHLNKAMISSQTEVTAATGDFVLLGDTSDSNNLKKTPVSSIIGLASGTTINNNADNRIITGSGTANTLNGEANLTFDSSLVITKSEGAANSLNDQISLEHTSGTTGYHIKTIRAASTDNPDGIAFVENTTERMRIRGGNVAIGTNDADIESLGANYKQLTISSPTTLYPGMITFQTPSSASGSAEIARVHYLNGTTRAAQFLVKPDGAANSAYMAWSTMNAGTLGERMRIDKAGNVGIGLTSNSTYPLQISASGTDPSLAVGVTTNSHGIIQILSTNTGAGTIHFGDSDSIWDGYISYGHSNQRLDFGVNGAAKMYLMHTTQSNGALRIGTTSPLASSPEKMSIQGTAGLSIKTTDYYDYAPLYLWQNAANATNSTTNLYVGFTSHNGVNVGSISSVGSTTSYNTTSDYRLKENVSYDWDATTRLKQLKPARFNFTTNADTIVDGFLAHEVEDIVPEAITGEKDAMKDEEYEITPAVLDENGNVVTEAVRGTRTVPNYQGIDQSKLVPLLVKAIQEQQTIIDDLKSRIETLEG